MRVEHRLRGGFKAASEARQMLSELKEHVPEDVLHSITLLVNELVTNAVRHGMIGRGEEVLLGIDVLSERLRVEVKNPGRGKQVLMREPSLDEGSGWGLQIVEMLSDRWGSDQQDGTLVWFEIDLRNNH